MIREAGPTCGPVIDPLAAMYRAGFPVSSMRMTSPVPALSTRPGDAVAGGGRPARGVFRFSVTSS